MKKILKTVLYTLLSLLVLAIIAVSVFAATNPDLAKGAFDLLLSAPGNNLKAAWIFITSDSSSIGQQIDNNTQKYEDAVSNIIQGVTDNGETLSKEALEALNSGNYTEEEMTRIIASGGAELEAINKEKLEKEQASQTENIPEKEEAEKNPETEENTPDTSDENIAGNNTQTQTPSQIEHQQTPDTTNEETTYPIVPPATDVTEPDTSVPPEQSTTEPVNPEVGEEITPPATQEKNVDTASYIAKLYVVKSRFLNELTSVEKSIRKEYVSLPKEKRIPSERQRIAGQYIKTVAKMEVECDKEVDAILDELKAELIAAGKDTSMTDNLLNAYKEEKSLKKAYYLDVYMNGLP